MWSVKADEPSAEFFIEFFSLHRGCFGEVFSISIVEMSALFWNTLELDGTELVVLKATRKTSGKNSTEMSLKKNHDTVTQDNPRTLWWAVSFVTCRGRLISPALLILLLFYYFSITSSPFSLTALLRGLFCMACMSLLSWGVSVDLRLSAWCERGVSSQAEHE